MLTNKLAFSLFLMIGFNLQIHAQVYISEVMYNTPGLDDEWIEICNIGATDEDLSLWDITFQGSELFEFPMGTTLAANNCITIAVGDDGEADGFNDCNGNADCGGIFTPDYNATAEPINTPSPSADNTLTNGASTYIIELRDDMDIVQSSIGYMRSNGGNSDGFSQKFDAAGTFLESNEGTPGFLLNDCSNIAVGDLVITEIMVDEAVNQDEWFELYNTTNTTINIVGLDVADDTDSETIISATPINIAPGGYIVLSIGGSAGCGAATAVYNISTFGLRNTGDKLSIQCNGVLIDEVDFTNGFPIVEGEALNFNVALLDGSNDNIENDNVANWCLATTDCSPNELGTPGAMNISCTVSNCPINLTDADLLNGAGEIPDGTYQVANDITTSGNVVSGSTVVLDAGNSITLTTGFTAANGADFLAVIGGCTSSANAIETRSADMLAVIHSTVYPNPMQTQGTISLQLSSMQKVNIKLYDLTGRLRQTILPLQEIIAGEHTYSFNTTDLVSATYLIKIQTKFDVQWHQIVVVE